MNDESFVTESNRIEGILRPPTPAEIAEHVRFIGLQIITVRELEQFVSVYQSGAILRDRDGLDVRVGGYLPPRGSKQIRTDINALLTSAHHSRDPFTTHVAYESLHPFTDGNGRSGRALWAWHMQRLMLDYSIGFLHRFYYQTLQHLS